MDGDLSGEEHGENLPGSTRVSHGRDLVGPEGSPMDWSRIAPPEDNESGHGMCCSLHIVPFSPHCPVFSTLSRFLHIVPFSSRSQPALEAGTQLSYMWVPSRLPMWAPSRFVHGEYIRTLLGYPCGFCIGCMWVPHRHYSQGEG